MFDVYWFADYSGAASPSAQKKAIRLVEAVGSAAPREVHGPFTRAALRIATLQRLERATREGQRVMLGFDHQVGLPSGLARELGLGAESGRDALWSFVRGDYAPDAPAVAEPARFAPAFNAWCAARGRPPYFYSAIRGPAWGLPRSDPRRDEPPERCTRFRLCEKRRPESARGSPKPLNRVGDLGSVGGQSLLGWVELLQLVEGAAAAGVKLRIWPLEGLDLGDPVFADAHVLVEPYPAAMRDPAVPPSDLADARAAALYVQRRDQAGALSAELNLSTLDPSTAARAQREGWIVGYPPV